MKSNRIQKKIYRLKNVSIDEIVKSFQMYNAEGKLTEMKIEEIPTVGINTPSTDIAYIKDATNKYASILYDKFIYLIHLIRSRQIANGGGFATFHSTVLESVFGKDYAKMIKLLLQLNYLQTDSFYKIGEKSYGFRFADEVEFTVTYENPTYLAKYTSKMSKIFQESAQQIEKENRLICKIPQNGVIFEGRGKNFASALNF